MEGGKEDMYDEFGNYIGPDLNEDDLSSSSDREPNNSSEESQDSPRTNGIVSNQQRKFHRDGSHVQGAGKKRGQQEEGSSPMIEDEDDYKGGYHVVLHEDKQYYPDAEKIYGPGVETLIMDEDAQPLTQPIIEPPRDKSFYLWEKEIPQTTYSLDYLSGLSTKPQLIRNVVVAGHLHHGKTLLCDMFVQQTHNTKKSENWDLKCEMKWTDNRKDEVDRHLSIKAAPITMVLQDSREKSWLFNIIDTPGHPNFSDEVSTGIRLADGMLLVIDCIEGVTFQTERLIKEAIRANLDIVVVLNKLDRFVIELRIPMNDAYHKIKHTLDEVNSIIQTFQFQLSKQCNDGSQTNKQLQISPVNNNVVFSSSLFGCCFSLGSFAKKYSEMNFYNSGQCQTSYQKHSQKVKSSNLDPLSFQKFLWGDIFYNESTRKFTRKNEGNSQRSFIHFILEPFYKIVSATISNEKAELLPIIKKLGLLLQKKDYSLDIKPLLKLVLRSFFGSINCLVDAMTLNIRSANEGTRTKVQYYYRNSNDDKEQADQLSKCDAKGPLCVNIIKLIHNEQNGNFYSLGRIISGTIKRGDDVKVLGEGFTLEEEEDMIVRNVQKLWIMQSRYKIEVDMMTAGNWVMIEGIDQSIAKTATVFHTQYARFDIFKPLEFHTDAVVKLACEPLNPSELPKMLDGLRKISKSYPLAKTKVEESGEHILYGTGELYMDSILSDLRTQFADIEIKVSEPFVSFAETVADTSSIKCFAETPNKKNQISMIAEPLDKGLAQYIEAGMLDMIPNIVIKEFQWDELTAQSIWAFGPNRTGTNMLIDYTLSSEVDKQRLNSVKDFMVQGFQWSTKEGPLCEEPIKNVKFKILGGQFASEPVYRSGSQLIPTARRVCYSSFLLGSPRIMEPIYLAEIYCPQDTVEAVYNVLIRRRAHVIFEEPKPGSPLYTLKVEIPAIESFGFETDLRTHTVGQAMVLSQFSHWNVVPGDPLDKSIELRPLEPSAVPHLAREFMVKTRRRKGLLEDVSIAKFFDSSTMLEMAKSDPSLQNYF